MSDALSVAHAALLKATEALSKVQSHEQECARRYSENAAALIGIKADTQRRHEENAETLGEMKRDIRELLDQNNAAKGRAEQNRVILGGIPNALWVAVISLLSGAVIAVGTWFLKQHGG